MCSITVIFEEEIIEQALIHRYIFFQCCLAYHIRELPAEKYEKLVNRPFRITRKWVNIKKWGRGSGGKFHINHCILSTRASSLFLCLQEYGKGLLCYLRRRPLTVIDTKYFFNYFMQYRNWIHGTHQRTQTKVSDISPSPFLGLLSSLIMKNWGCVSYAEIWNNRK